MEKRKYKIFLVAYLVFTSLSIAQSSTFIDSKGIMRWAKDKKEICVFGTNYSVPFAYWDARAPLIGDRHKEAIEEDVYHMARLGIDGFRIHVMETYIADEEGNLIYNQHFELFDYLLFKLKERGIKMYITPMYLGSAIDGSFTKKYGSKIGCLSNEAAFPAQENYLKQFVSHVNPLTGIAYKDDPDIIAFEIVNEPTHWKAPNLVEKYINRMYDGIRSTGCDKPLLYNMTTCASFIDQVLNTKIEGGSFQWYPTGLTSNHLQKGNLLPNVDQYVVPFQDELTASKRPKFVYEFSPSDTKGAYMYPAMARSFREAGFQFAAHFSYDPLHEAHANIEYRTHFLNLIYTPKKAIGLMIASEVFHELKLNKSYGRFPENNQFEGFNLSYENDLAEYVGQSKFLYSNSTESVPKNLKKLTTIAGTGNSKLVSYTGTGAYFLDKLDKENWRLEVLPDAHWVRDPFFVSFTQGELAVALAKKQKMKIRLPELGADFEIKGINKDNRFSSEGINSEVEILPGTYVISKKGNRKEWKGTAFVNNIQLNEFHTTTRKSKQDYLLHDAPEEISVGESLKLSAKIISENDIEQVEVILLKKGGGIVLPMQKKDTYNYEVVLPKEYIKTERVLRYHISYKSNGEYYNYPSGNKETYLLDRRIYGDDMSVEKEGSYSVRVVPNKFPVYLFDAEKDWEQVTKMNRKDNLKIFPSIYPDKSVLRVPLPKANKFKDEYSFRFYCKDKIVGRLMDLNTKKRLSVYGKKSLSGDSKVHIQLVLENGEVYGKDILLSENLEVHSVLFSDLVQEKSVLLPRAYPSFQSYDFGVFNKKSLDISQLEAVQFRVDKGNVDTDKTLEIDIAWVYLE